MRDSGMLGYFKKDTILEYYNGSCKLIWDPKSKETDRTSSFIPKEELSLEKVSFISDKRNLIPDLIDSNATVKKEHVLCQRDVYGFPDCRERGERAGCA